MNVRVHAKVAAALAAGGPVVALESTLVAHGLPRPDNLALAREEEEIVRHTGAVPATIAMLNGEAYVGLSAAELEYVANTDGIAKLSARDLAIAAALGRDGATTVAGTAVLAAQAGIKVFATGGLGGVHRGASETWDESADLAVLARTRIVVVCAGVKSILDVGATLERLETLSVAVVGFRTKHFPGFYLTDSGFPIDWEVEDAAAVAEILRGQGVLGESAALIVANPIPAAEQLNPRLHDRVLERGLAELERQGIRGKRVTPFLLDYFKRETGGESLRVNKQIIRNNVRLAAQIASAL
jgi:pseudouridylate synthase